MKDFLFFTGDKISNDEKIDGISHKWVAYLLKGN